jgi:catechol 2,3-dioxygenase-like lactoylglutathione lyase family enzyme
MMMKPRKPLALSAATLAALALPLAAAAQERQMRAPEVDARAPEGTVRTPEGALLDTSGDLAYELSELSEEQLTSPARALFRQDSMNVFRRFPREQTEAMVKFYTEALALRSLSPIQLTSSQQMLLTGVGSGQIKLSAGQQGDRKYDLSGGVTGGTGIRYLALTYPDADTVRERFTAAGFPAPTFADRGDGTRAALVEDPAGFPILVVIDPQAKDHSDDGVGVGIGVSDLTESRAFYREFVGLDELEPVQDATLGVTRYPYRHAETMIHLHEVPAGSPADTGSAGIQYVVSDAALVDAKGRHRQIAVETPLNKLRGFDLTTVWLNDPDGVTNYFAQVGPDSRTAQQQQQAPAEAPGGG